MDYNTWKESSAGKSAEILGAGVSNLPLVDFLLESGMRVRVRDRKSKEQLGKIYTELEQKGACWVTGENYLDDLDADYVFRSPGIRPDLPQILKALQNGAKLYSEMELFFDLCPCKTVAVTGSDGKTTTTTLVSLLLKEAGANVFVGGNIGAPLLPYVRQMQKDDFAVLELSSFQLMTMRRSAQIAAVTNLSPNHLDWHTGMEEYVAAKTNIFTHGENELLVLNADDAHTPELLALPHGNLRFFSSVDAHADLFEKDGDVYLHGSRLLSARDVRLPGRHNKQNYMTAYAEVMDFVPPEVLRKVASTFNGVEHRLEFVREYRGVRIYNSSIDSSPSRTAAALSCFTEKTVVICGGYDKHIPFEPLAQALCEKAKLVVLTGATANAIAEAVRRCPAEEKPQIVFEPLFADAVAHAVDLCRKGDVLLLSPGCASFDAFPNFMARGEAFKKQILALS